MLGTYLENETCWNFMAVTRKSDIPYLYQLSKKYHDKVKPLMYFYSNQYWIGTMPLDEAWLKTSYAVRYFYIYQEVTETDLMRWAIRSKETTPHP
jgi:hypothetical protein